MIRKQAQCDAGDCFIELNPSWVSSSQQPFHMSDVERASSQERIEKLKEELNSLENDYMSLLHHSNPTYVTYLKQIEVIFNQKQVDIEEWAKNENVAANKYYKAQIYSIENDFEDKSEKIVNRIEDYICFKNDELDREFSEAAGYFAQQGYTHNRTLKNKTIPPHLFPNIDIQQSEKPVFTEEEVQQDKLKLQNAADTRGPSVLNLSTSDKAVLLIPGLEPLSGIIGKMSEETFEFIREGFPTMNLTYTGIQFEQYKIIPE